MTYQRKIKKVATAVGTCVLVALIARAKYYWWIETAHAAKEEEAMVAKRRWKKRDEKKGEDDDGDESEYSSATEDEGLLFNDDDGDNGNSSFVKRGEQMPKRLASTTTTTKDAAEADTKKRTQTKSSHTITAMDRIKEESTKEKRLMHSESSDASSSSPSWSQEETDPNFFASTKFFACLELEESRELFRMSEELEIAPNQVLFRQGDESRDGIYVVVEGELGVYVQTQSSGKMSDGYKSMKSSSKPSGHNFSVSDMRRSFDRAGSPGLPVSRGGSTHGGTRFSSTPSARSSLDKERPNIKFSIGPAHLTNILNKGESVGDVDILDSARRSVSCVAMNNGVKLVRIRQDVLFAFIKKYPRTLQVYLEQAIARLWRVARFTLRDFLELPRDEGGEGDLSPGAEDCLTLKPKNYASSSNFSTESSEEGSLYLAGDEKSFDEETPEDANPTMKLLVRHQDALEQYAVKKTLLANEVFITQRDSQTSAYFILLRGTMRRDAVPWPEGDGVQGSLLEAPRLVGAAHAITGAKFDETLRCCTDCDILLITPYVLNTLCMNAPDACIALQLAASCSLNRAIRAFISAGLNRQWLSAGDVAFKRGKDATSMYLVISGRVSIYNVALKAMRYRSRGETLGEAAMLSQTAHTSTAICARDCELVRMSRASVQIISSKYPEVAGRLLEHVARKLELNQRDLKTGERYRPEIITIAIVPASEAVQISKLPKFAAKLRNSLEKLGKGSAFILDESSAAEVVPEGFRRVETAFYRSKLTSWMTRIEEEHRFVLLVGDKNTSSSTSGWSRVCVSQADLVLVVADGGAVALAPSNNNNVSKSIYVQGDKEANTAVGLSSKTKLFINGGVDPSPAETKLLWKRRKKRLVPVNSASEEEFYEMDKNKKREDVRMDEANFDEEKNSAILAQIELILLHGKGESPKNTRRFYLNRPGLRRHHHCRLNSYSDADIDRVARHIAGCGVGVVLAGGGGHGLAHLGALKALEDEGVPIDAIGGASQGTLTAALYARTANSTIVSARVRKLAGLIASPRRLLTDLTPPFLSILTGDSIDKAIRDMFGDMEIEDLWIPFFCCATNLTTGKLISCTSGSVWRYARASMSVLGFLPPIADELTGDLLVDGAYLNPCPVDVLRKLSRVESTIVVDVEDEHYSAFRSLTARDGGLGGWRLLWERVSPFAHADKFYRSLFNKTKNKDTTCDDDDSPSSSSCDDEDGDEDDDSKRKSSKRRRRSKQQRVFGSQGAPSYATLLGALLRATSRREVAEAAKTCEIDVYLRPPGVPPFTFHTGLTDTRTDELIRRARHKSQQVIRKWLEAKRLKDENTVASAASASYYGFYSSSTNATATNNNNSQGRLSVIQPPMRAQTKTSSESPRTRDGTRSDSRPRRTSFEDDYNDDDDVKEEEEEEEGGDKAIKSQKITPRRYKLDIKTVSSAKTNSTDRPSRARKSETKRTCVDEV